MKLLTHLFIGLFMTLTATTHSLASVTNIIKSANDHRDYAYTELPNGLKLLVISDAKAQRAAAAVDVNVGTSAEPEEFPGLAHFLEHMLFLGTDQYPNSDDYINYINDHGGNHNAFTAFSHTNYFFDIDPAYLQDGLKRFSRFFVAPLLSQQYVERERNAVDSEYQSRRREDSQLGSDAFKQAVNPKHPYSRFSIGNNTTLPNETVRPALIKFYEKYYSADRMTAIIIGKEEVKTLTRWGRELFSAVPKRDRTDLTIAQKLFDGVNLPIEIKSKSVRNEKNLSLHFQFPYQPEDEYSKSLYYLSYVLGYEGEGSLLAALKTLGYASALYSGSGYRIGQETSFEIGIQLTDKGYQNINHITAMIFAYIELLRNDDDAQQRYKEIATIAQTAFKFREKHNATDEASTLATRLNHFPVKDVQAINAIFSGYNAKQIDTYLSKMTPENVVLQLTAPDIQATQKTQYFDTAYVISPVKVADITMIPKADLAVIAMMHLPNKNPFIADNYNLQKDKITEKTEVLDNGIKLFYKNDTTFQVPLSSVQISLQPTNKLSITDKVAITLLSKLIDEQLTAALYDASVAGVDITIGANEKALILSLNGYQQKMPALLRLILSQLRHVTIDPAMFARVKTDYRQDLENTSTAMPYQQTFLHLNNALVTDASLPAQRLAVLEHIDEKTIANFAKKILQALAVQMMVYGNDTYLDAKALGKLISTVLNEANLNNTWHPNNAKNIVTSESKTFNVNHDDNAITYYIKAGKGYVARAEIGLLVQMLSPKFFTKLRTEMQLGYVVFAYPRVTFDQAGVAFTIQSPVATADELQQHITEFNAHFAKQLNMLTESDFNTAKAILKGELLQEPENLMSAAGLYWADILNTGKTDASRKAIADKIDNIKLTEFIPTMQAVLTEGKQVIIKAVSNL
ncbi:MAG: insulinase family protein [Ostreibacterium sp.]